MNHLILVYGDLNIVLFKISASLFFSVSFRIKSITIESKINLKVNYSLFLASNRIISFNQKIRLEIDLELQ